MANPISKYLSHTDDWRHPIWTFRVAPLLSLIALVLAMTVWTSGRVHMFCVGLAVGQLTVFCIVLFQVKEVTFREDPDASPVQQLSLNS